ncbi:MAG: hypothetical protein GVY13_14110 [Alphaproteobacteria bacterium]|nr:hypothetical protein [Alphaproteobacteria bacterium]
MLRSIMNAQGRAVHAATLLQSDRLQMLEGMLGRPRLESLLRQLAERATQDLNAIVVALEAGDGAQASGLAHGLKGAAGMLGAARLAAAAEAFCDAADQGRSPMPALEDLRRAVADTLRYLPPPDREDPT